MWVSVEINKPRHKQEVIVRRQNGKMHLATYINIPFAENSFVSKEIMGMTFIDVTHWFPVPEFTHD